MFAVIIALLQRLRGRGIPGQAEAGLGLFQPLIPGFPVLSKAAHREGLAKACSVPGPGLLLMQREFSFSIELPLPNRRLRTHAQLALQGWQARFRYIMSCTASAAAFSLEHWHGH